VEASTVQGGFALDGAQTERHNEPGGTVETAADGAAVGEFGEGLTGRLQIRSEPEHFGAGGDPAGEIMAHDAGQILTNPQAEQTILGELLAGEAVPGLLVHLPGPEQHLVCNGCIIEVAVRFALGEDMPGGNQ
jgi:hypothetical protein